MELLFWALIAAVVWCYAGYPLFIAALSRVRPLPLRPLLPPDARPMVTIVLAVRNERSVLARRLENLLGQRYPAERLDLLVVCNGTQDGSDDVARDVARRDPRVRVLASPAEVGKAGAINMAMRATEADVIVFADARQTFVPDAVARLVEPFADPGVGAVTGRLMVRRADEASVEGVRLYWGLETWLRHSESRSGSVVGATGAVYAVRRALCPEIPPNLILDDVYVPMCIAMGGFRVIMAPDAIAFDAPATSKTAEFARKRRTMVGNIQLVRQLPALLSPFRNPLFFRFMSHKVLRLLTPFCFVGLLIVSAMLPGLFYQLFFAAELAAYVLGGIGLFVSLPVLAIPSAFVLVHGAIFAAVWRWRDDASRVWAQPTGHAPVNAR